MDLARRAGFRGKQLEEILGASNLGTASPARSAQSSQVVGKGGLKARAPRCSAETPLKAGRCSGLSLFHAAENPHGLD